MASTPFKELSRVGALPWSGQLAIPQIFLYLAYRFLLTLREQNVLLVGAGTSSTDIARELGTVARRIYQVSRGGNFDLPSVLLPGNAERIGEIEAFERLPSYGRGSHIALNDASSPIPGTIVLKDGRRIANIHHIVLCTGYQFSHPFLLSYHEDDTPAKIASETVLVTDGTQIHNLHKDIFYIPDPTLAFVGVPFYTATFTLFEFQAMVVSAVWSGRASLPSGAAMREEYLKRLQEKGNGRTFHSLRDAEIPYVRELVAWLNDDAAKLGLQPIEGHTVEWHAADIERRTMFKARLATLEREKNGTTLRWVPIPIAEEPTTNRRAVYAAGP